MVFSQKYEEDAFISILARDTNLKMEQREREVDIELIKLPG